MSWKVVVSGWDFRGTLPNDDQVPAVPAGEC